MPENIFYECVLHVLKFEDIRAFTYRDTSVLEDALTFGTPGRYLSILLQKGHDSHGSVPATLTLVLVLRLVLEAAHSGGLTSQDQPDQQTADDHCIHDGICNRRQPYGYVTS